MISSTHFGDYTRRGTADEALARVPEAAFGETDWVRRALAACAEYLKPAIASGKPYRIANAVRAIAHAPSLAQLDAVIGAVCDAMLAEAYAGRNSRMVANLADARAVIDEAVAEVRTRTERAAADPSMLREQVDACLRLVGLHDASMAERLAATGTLAARIAKAMRIAPAGVLDIELAGSLSDVGMLGKRATRRHATLGEEYVRGLPALQHLASFVRSHHEHYDGTGYPDRLRGNEIPLAARIIGVAAAFIELVMPLHGEALLADEACTVLAARAGSELDPDVVAATLLLLQFRRRTNRTA